MAGINPGSSLLLHQETPGKKRTSEKPAVPYFMSNHTQ